MNLNDVQLNRDALDATAGGSTSGAPNLDSPGAQWPQTRPAARRPWARRAARVTLMATVLVGAAAGTIATSVANGAPSLATEAPRSSQPVVLGYRPMWLPSGYVERGRSWSASDPSRYPYRFWSDQPIGSDFGGANHQLSLSHGSPDELDSGARVKLEVNGQPAAYLPPINGAGESSLVWRYDAGTLLKLAEVGTGLTQESLVRIATSVQPDRTTATAPIRVSADLNIGDVKVIGDSAMSWQGRISVTPVADSAATAMVVAGTEPDCALEGERFTVEGHPAWLVTRYIGKDVETSKPFYLVVVDLRQDGGPVRYLTVSRFGASPDELVTVAERVDPQAQPDLAWLGR